MIPFYAHPLFLLYNKIKWQRHSVFIQHPQTMISITGKANMKPTMHKCKLKEPKCMMKCKISKPWLVWAMGVVGQFEVGL